MNQQCKVCGEPAAGFHFGAFTCEGCKSFFGRSYNNLSSISECKNNGDCVINKKNRTGCKACRLRKCLLVGMSKSGSRYGRRSNWFKIHCLLQEQQQAAETRHGKGSQPTSPNQMHLMHPGYQPGMFSRPPCTKEELMLLGLDEYAKHPISAASPSISSPDSHNSDSSIEIGDKRHSLSQIQTKHNLQNLEAQTALGLNNDLFMPFAGFPLMPPPGLLPAQSHLLFSSYQHALYQHHQLQMQQQQQMQNHQGLLKTAELEVSVPTSSPTIQSIHNHNGKHLLDYQNHSPKAAEKYSKRFFLDAMLESQRSVKIPKRSISPIRRNPDLEEDIDMSEEDEVLTMTPPHSPSTMQKSPLSLISPSAHKPIRSEHNPIDLSMKSTSSSSDDINHNKRKSHRCSPDNSSMDSQHSKHSNDDVHKLNFQMINHVTRHNAVNNCRITANITEEENHSMNDNAADEFKVDAKRKRLQTTTPLDLTLKV